MEIWLRIVGRRVLELGRFTSTADLRDRRVLAFIDHFNAARATGFKWADKGTPLAA